VDQNRAAPRTFPGDQTRRLAIVAQRCGRLALCLVDGGVAGGIDDDIAPVGIEGGGNGGSIADIRLGMGQRGNRCS
jgi:hypothetical protein